MYMCILYKIKNYYACIIWNFSLNKINIDTSLNIKALLVIELLGAAPFLLTWAYVINLKVDSLGLSTQLSLHNMHMHNNKNTQKRNTWKASDSISCMRETTRICNTQQQSHFIVLHLREHVIYQNIFYFI